MGWIDKNHLFFIAKFASRKRKFENKSESHQLGLRDMLLLIRKRGFCY